MFYYTPISSALSSLFISKDNMEKTDNLPSSIDLDAGHFIIKSNNNDSMFLQKIVENINTLLLKEESKAIIERIHQQGKSILIVEDPKLSSASSSSKIYFNLDEDQDLRFFFLGLRNQKISISSQIPSYIILAHEMIHLLHAFENGYRIQDYLEQKADNVCLGNKEEQYTITGILDITNKSVDPINENNIRKAFNLDLRLSYEGLLLPLDKAAKLNGTKLPQNQQNEIIQQIFWKGLEELKSYMNNPPPRAFYSHLIENAKKFTREKE